MKDFLERNEKTFLKGQHCSLPVEHDDAPIEKVIELTAATPAIEQRGGMRSFLAATLCTALLVTAMCWNRESVPVAQAASPDQFSAPQADQAESDLPEMARLTNAAIGSKKPVAAYESDKYIGPSTRSHPLPGQAYPVPNLEPVELINTASGDVHLAAMPSFKTRFAGKVAGISNRNEFVFYSLNPALQEYAEQVVQRARAPHVAIVAMDPRSGKVLAIADKSNAIKDLSLHAGFPAASLFKLVTAAAALEKSSIGPDSTIHFRGGTYSLNQWNYLPDRRRDRRSMSLAEALGRSCNPVFGRVALQYLNPEILRQYVRNFAFNKQLAFDCQLPVSTAEVPDDKYGLSLTGAGFGAVHLSPVHAAALVSAIANRGLMPRPFLIDRVVTKDGRLVYQPQQGYVTRVVQPSTAQRLMEMMEKTTTMGTSRKAFMRKGRPVLPGINVAAKTGTLKGDNPEGINNWFVAAAPVGNPTIAISVIVVDPVSINTRASELGKLILQRYLTK